MKDNELEELFREKATISVDDGVLARDFGFIAKKGEIAHKNRDINNTSKINTSASQFALSCEHFLKAPIIYHDLRNFSNIGAYSSNSEINSFIDDSLKRPLWIQSDVIKKGDIRKGISLSAPESAKKERFSGHDLFAYYQLQNPIIKTLINHEFLSNDGEDIFNYIDFGILTQDFIKEDDNGEILLPQKQLEIYNAHKHTFETKRYSSTHDRELKTTEDDIENLIQISNGLETIMCILFPTYDSTFNFNYSNLEKQLGEDIFAYYRLKNNIAKPLKKLDKISNFYLNNDFNKMEFENLLNSLTKINNNTKLNEENKEIFKNIYLNLCIYLKHCSTEKETGIYFSPQVFKRIENYCKIVMNSNLFDIKGNQLRNSTFFSKNKTQLESSMLTIQNQFKEAQKKDKEMIDLSEKINEFIDILNNGGANVLKRFTTHCFKDGTSTGVFWYKNKDLIIKKLFDELRYEKKYDTARNVINRTSFNLDTKEKIEMFIEILNEGYIPKSMDKETKFSNGEPINMFWATNKDKIIEELNTNPKYETGYEVAKQTILNKSFDKIADFIELLNSGYIPKFNDPNTKFSNGEPVNSFWANNKDKIIEELNTNPKYETGYEVAKQIILNKSFDKIADFIELLNSGYIPKFNDPNTKFSNGEPVNSFWANNKYKIIEELNTNPKYETGYEVAKQIVLNKMPNKVQDSIELEKEEKTSKSSPKEVINAMNMLGYNHKEIIEMTKKYPAIFTLSIDSIKNKIDYMMSIGYSHKEIIEMTKKYPVIFTLSIDSIKNKIDYMMSIGYNHKEIIEMTKKYPAIFTLSIDSIENKIDYMMSLGYSHEELLKMIKVYPMILLHNIDEDPDRKRFRV